MVSTTDCLEHHEINVKCDNYSVCGKCIKNNLFRIRLIIMKGTTSRNVKLWRYKAKELSVTMGNLYKILKVPPIFQKYVQTRVKL